MSSDSMMILARCKALSACVAAAMLCPLLLGATRAQATSDVVRRLDNAAFYNLQERSDKAPDGHFIAMSPIVFWRLKAEMLLNQPEKVRSVARPIWKDLGYLRPPSRLKLLEDLSTIDALMKRTSASASSQFWFDPKRARGEHSALSVLGSTTPLDMGSDSARHVINGWINQATHGLMPSALADDALFFPGFSNSVYATTLTLSFSLDDAMDDFVVDGHGYYPTTNGNFFSQRAEGQYDFYRSPGDGVTAVAVNSKRNFRVYVFAAPSRRHLQEFFSALTFDRWQDVKRRFTTRYGNVTFAAELRSQLMETIAAEREEYESVDGLSPSGPWLKTLVSISPAGEVTATSVGAISTEKPYCCYDYPPGAVHHPEFQFASPISGIVVEDFSNTILFVGY